MTRPTSIDDYDRIAPLVAAQLSLLATIEPGPGLPENGRLSERPTEIFDVTGDLLFWRAPVERDRRSDSFVDIAARPELGAPLVAINTGAPWLPDELLDRARAAVGAEITHRADEIRFVAYSFPKIAVGFYAGGEELALIELFSWQPVPPADPDAPIDDPDADPNFRRISFLGSLTPDELERRRATFQRSVSDLAQLAERLDLRELLLRRLDRSAVIDLTNPLVETRELPYGPVRGDHRTCFELRGQETNVWCVAASVQMVLDFYRYHYPQTRLAAELGLGTLANPNGLPYSQDARVVTALESMTKGALSAAMNTAPSFAQFQAEIRAGRPLISFVPGHSRAVAGYHRVRLDLLGGAGFRGLLVFDPWPPNAGVITRWENAGATAYRRTFTAHVTLV